MTSRYRVEIARRAVKSLTSLQRRDQQRIRAAIDLVADEPRPLVASRRPARRTVPGTRRRLPHRVPGHRRPPDRPPRTHRASPRRLPELISQLAPKAPFLLPEAGQRVVASCPCRLDTSGRTVRAPPRVRTRAYHSPQLLPPSADEGIPVAARAELQAARQDDDHEPWHEVKAELGLRCNR